MKRVNPLSALPTPTRTLSYAPPPWTLLECTETGMVFLENPPGYDALKQEFAWEVTSAAQSAARLAAEPVAYRLSGIVKRMRARWLKRNKMGALIAAQLLRAPAGELRLLDLGCGWGGLLDTVIDALPPALGSRCIAHGIEISNELALIADERMRGRGGCCVHSDALQGLGQFREGFFNVIVMSSFLEHEIEPLALLRACRERLGPEGSVVLKVPNYACLNRHLRGARWCGFRWPDHVNYFTPRTLAALAARAGFAVQRMNFFDRHPLSDSMYAVLQPR